MRIGSIVGLGLAYAGELKLFHYNSQYNLNFKQSFGIYCRELKLSKESCNAKIIRFDLNLFVLGYL